MDGDKISYHGKLITIYALAKLTKLPSTTLYRYKHLGYNTGEGILKALVEDGIRIYYNGEYITYSQLSKLVGMSTKRIKRRLATGISLEDLIAGHTLDGRNPGNQTCKLSPTDVLDIYYKLFKRLETQTTLAEQYNLDPSTVSNIWTGKRWGWLTSPLRYTLEGQVVVDLI